MANGNKPSALRNLTQLVTGRGYSSEISEINEMLPRLSEIPTVEQGPASGITKALRKRIEANRPLITTRYESADAYLVHFEFTLGAFVSEEIEKVTRLSQVPSRRAFLTDENVERFKAKSPSYAAGLTKAWQTFSETAIFCVKHPGLVDASAVDYLLSFSELAHSKDWPGADVVKEFAFLVGTRYVNETSPEGTPLPDGSGGGLLSYSASEAVSKPSVTAASIFRKFLNLPSARRLIFSEIAEECAIADYPLHTASFTNQLKALADLAVIEMLKKPDLARPSDLENFRICLDQEVETISREHKLDVDKVLKLDAKHKDVLEDGLQALVRIKARSKDEFGKLAPSVWQRYKEHRRAVENVSKNDIIPGFSARHVAEYLPCPPTIELDLSPYDYFEELKEFVAALEIETGPVDDLSLEQALSPLANDKLYEQTVKKVIKSMNNEIDRIFEESVAAGNPVSKKALNVRGTIANYSISQRERDYHALRCAVYDSLKRFLLDKEFVSNPKFQYLVTQMEQMKVVHPETYKHCAKAFVKAARAVPERTLEKTFGPKSECTLMKASSITMERSMSRSQGMSMSM